MRSRLRKLFSHPGLFPREQAKKLANEREITRSGAGNNLKRNALVKGRVKLVISEISDKLKVKKEK